jgi:hypothetical protein
MVQAGVDYNYQITYNAGFSSLVYEAYTGTHAPGIGNTSVDVYLNRLSGATPTPAPSTTPVPGRTYYVAGCILDWNANPISGLKVQIVDGEYDSIVHQVYATFYTNSDGNFNYQFPNLPTGYYGLYLSGDGYKSTKRGYIYPDDFTDGGGTTMYLGTWLQPAEGYFLYLKMTGGGDNKNIWWSVIPPSGNIGSTGLKANDYDVYVPIQIYDFQSGSYRVKLSKPGYASTETTFTQTMFSYNSSSSAYEYYLSMALGAQINTSVVTAIPSVTPVYQRLNDTQRKELIDEGANVVFALLPGEAMLYIVALILGIIALMSRGFK